MKRRELIILLNNDESAFQFLINNNLIKDRYVCQKCNARKTVTNIGVNKCNSRINGGKCGALHSIFNNTIFEKSKIDYKIILLLLYEWTLDTSTDVASSEYECSQSTVSAWYQKFRELATSYYNLFLNNPIGGQNITVQIDETCIVKNKYNQGRQLANQKWIFGGVVLGNHKQCFFEYVEHRNEDTLLEVIQRKILPGSIIMSDMWGGYQNLETRLAHMGYVHSRVNHSQNFINPINGANTQSIESFWSVTKRTLRKKGTNYGNFNILECKIKENLFKKQFYNNKMEKMIEIISIVYNN